ncbi:MAG: hypothetical protein QOI70_1141, partial [Microbacteriaceae bacterium]|nr:hypothetical protein [Microbacteriaceae bacterium]
LNFVTGFLVTLLLVWYVMLPTGGAGVSVTCYSGSYTPAPSGRLGCPGWGLGIDPL